MDQTQGGMDVLELMDYTERDFPDRTPFVIMLT